MKYTVTKSTIDMIGTIWLPAVTCAATETVPQSSVDNLRDLDGAVTRDSVQDWIDMHCGDFQNVTDFAASIELPNRHGGTDTLDIPWRDEESEMTFNDLMFGEDD